MKSPSFESLSLDAGLDLLRSRVETLSRQKLAAFFGCIGAGMLPIYVRFSESNHWGDASVLREALDAAFEYAAGKSDLHGTREGMLTSIAAVIPHEDDFEVPESTFAMDVAICVDAAVRAGDPEQNVEPTWVEYALDPVITTLCEQQTGYLDLGSSRQADVWQTQALRNPAVKGAFEALAEMVDLLSEMESPINQEHLEGLLQLAARLVL